MTQHRYISTGDEEDDVDDDEEDDEEFDGEEGGEEEEEEEEATTGEPNQVFFDKQPAIPQARQQLGFVHSCQLATSAILSNLADRYRPCQTKPLPRRS